jgi:hypothetical protein
MNCIEERCWLLVVSVGAGPQSLAGQRMFLAAWNEWFDRGKPFAVLRSIADVRRWFTPRVVHALLPSGPTTTGNGCATLSSASPALCRQVRIRG